MLSASRRNAISGLREKERDENDLDQALMTSLLCYIDTSHHPFKLLLKPKHESSSTP